MEVLTKQIVKKLPKNLRLISIVQEAITNSIQANANQIEVFFETIDNNLIEGTNLKVKRVIVCDNGEGFTDDNIKSFNQFMSDYKYNLGCKGIGRFTYLTICSNIEIFSHNKNKPIKFNFTLDTQAIVPQNCFEFTTLNQTKIVFNDIQNKTISCDLKQEVKLIVEHFISTFKFMVDDKKNVLIKIFLNNDFIEKIDSNRYGKGFTDDYFEIQLGEIIEKFNVSYKKQGSSIKGFYCANKRSVKEDGLEINFRTKNDSGLLFFVTSNFFDENVNDERTDFTIKDEDKNLMYLDWNTINKHLFAKINTICKNEGIDIEEISIKNKNESIKNAPYLAAYISKSKNMATSASIIKEAKELFELDKSYIRNTKNINNSDYEERLYTSNQAELAEYFFDREKIIKDIKNTIDDTAKKRNETIIHDKIMKRKTSDKNQLDYKNSNLWLFDERFMTYTYAYSDNTINKILQLSDNDKNIRPDICIFTKSKKDASEIVLIELKGSDATGEKNSSGINELNKYARKIKNYFEQNGKEILIWSYLITTFNKETKQEIEDTNGIKRAYTTKGDLYYLYNDNLNMVTHILTLDTMVEDAMARNQLFLNILRGNIGSGNI